MAAQMVIPSSNDTLFIRGFSSRHRIEDIRDFFTHEGGRNSIEFFKENLTGDGLFLALRFDSKSVAKDILNRFDGYEVLGDRISISWYKDIRKARAFDSFSGMSAGPRVRGQQWGQDYRDVRNSGSYGRGGSGRGGQYGSRGSGGRQSGSWSGGYPREYGEGGGRTRRYTRSSSRSRSRSYTPHSHSRSYSRSSSRDDDRDSRSRSGDSRERPRKRHRSTSNGSRRRRRSRKNRGRDVSSDSRSGGEFDDGSHSGSESASPPARPAKQAKKLKTATKKSASAADSEASSAKANVGGDYEEPDVNEFDSSALQQSAGGKASRVGLRSAITAVDKPSAAAAKRLAGQKVATLDDEIEAANVPESELASEKKRAAVDSGSKGKKPKADRRPYEETLSDEEEGQIVDKSGSTKQQEDRLKRLSAGGSDLTNQGSSIFDEIVAKRKVATVPKKPAVIGAQKEFDPFENMAEQEDVEPDDPKPRNRRGLGTTDNGGAGDKSRRAGAGAATKRGGREAASAGVLGLSHEKVLLVRQKKDEIEKAYRQDCETFATVTKMLINKEPSLEDKVQDSLRENLKEIGQRCIQELREFIERLREEDDGDS